MRQENALPVIYATLLFPSQLFTEKLSPSLGLWQPHELSLSARSCSS